MSELRDTEVISQLRALANVQVATHRLSMEMELDDKEDSFTKKLYRNRAQSTYVINREKLEAALDQDPVDESSVTFMDLAGVGARRERRSSNSLWA